MTCSRSIRKHVCSKRLSIFLLGGYFWWTANQYQVQHCRHCTWLYQKEERFQVDHIQWVWVPISGTWTFLFRFNVIFPAYWCHSPRCSGGLVGKWRGACNYVSGICRNLNSLSNSPVASRRLSCQISVNQREAETNANLNKRWKTRAKGNDVITNVISANQHFASTFSMQIFKFQRRSCKLRRAFSQAKISPNQCMYVGPFSSLLDCVMHNKVLKSCGCHFCR